MLSGGKVAGWPVVLSTFPRADGGADGPAPKVQTAAPNKAQVSGTPWLHAKMKKEDADAALGNAGITINKNTVPGETRSPFVTSGIRVGSPALTSRGMKENEFEFIANKMADVLDDITNTQLQASIKEELKTLAQNFVIYNQPTY